MIVDFLYGKNELHLKVPDDSIIYQSGTRLCHDLKSEEELIIEGLFQPIDSDLLKYSIQRRKAGRVVIVVSDITRPVPYKKILPAVLADLHNNGVNKEDVLFLVATGMHRPSTTEEKILMFGQEIVDNYSFVDHDATDNSQLSLLKQSSASGSDIILNKHYVEAGFRIVTGLVEPHFMAGFSGGRKAICPGLASLETIRRFHGYSFLDNPNASHSIQKGNPCHEEAASVADALPPEFTINVVLNKNREIVALTSGEIHRSHKKATELVSRLSCVPVLQKADVAITSCGGFPLDSTFYQCVKGFVSCNQALSPHGQIIAFGSCSEGIGGQEYSTIMKKYKDNWTQFLEDIQDPVNFTKDQWQFQMHTRALKITGLQGLHFFTHALPEQALSELSVTGHAIALDRLNDSIQSLIDLYAAKKLRFALFPEGPYCVPTLNELSEYHTM